MNRMLFKQEFIPLILDGSKTHSRRLLKPQPYAPGFRTAELAQDKHFTDLKDQKHYPKYLPGDIVWAIEEGQFKDQRPFAKIEITKVRVERLHDISKEDAIKEGFVLGKYQGAWLSNDGKTFSNDAVFAFQQMWELIYGAESWQSNPWVWAYEFRIVENETN